MAPSPSRDRAGRALLGLSALGAVGAGIGAFAALGDAADDVAVVEAWRAVGLVFFAAVFVVLAGQPRGRQGLWEATIAAKAALPVLGLTVLRGRPGAHELVVVDGLLVLVLLVAYGLTEGWRAHLPQPGERSGVGEYRRPVAAQEVP